MNPNFSVIWRPLLAGLVAWLGLSAFVVWNWHMLGEWDRQETEHRFELNVEALGQRVQARMYAYEMVLRGFSSTFAGEDHHVSPQQWREVVDHMRVQNLYPGISSVSWARYVPAAHLPAFEALARADGKADFRVFPPGAREHYLPIEYIGPINERTRRVVGLDLLTQAHQRDLIQTVIDSGQASLSQPMTDFYAVSSETANSPGALLYLPVYKNGKPPAGLAERRAAFLGMVTAIFRGQNLVRDIFGEQLSLFHIVMQHVPNNEVLFDSAADHPVAAPADWQANFHTQLNLKLYGRDWRIDITGTPDYEIGLAAGRDHEFTLILGLSVALLMTLLAAYFYHQHERQLHLKEQIAQRLTATNPNFWPICRTSCARP